MMPWEDEERMIAALELKGRTVCANVVRRIGLPSPDGRRMAETQNSGSGRKPDQQVPGSKTHDQGSSHD